MASIGSLQSATSSVSAGLLRAADDNTAVVATLLKKVADSDKNLVNTLLPASGEAGGLNIAA